MSAEAIASITTAAGTLILAVATFAATRTANRASRVAEDALLAGLQPVLVHARLDDGEQRVGFADRHWVSVRGPAAAFEEAGGAIYLVVPVRNAGSGIAVLQGWYPRLSTHAREPHAPIESFRMHGRDMYVAAGDLGFWQAALRDPSEPVYGTVAQALHERQPIAVDVLYTDLHGGQRTVSRFSISPDGDGWTSSVSRHWPIDGPRPR